MRSRDTDIVIVPGLGGSGPDHWQSRWQARLPNAIRVEQDDWHAPDLDRWVEQIIETVAACERPVVLVAHSLGAVAVAHAAMHDLPQVVGAFLVTPPDENILRDLSAVDPAFTPLPAEVLPFPAIVVASRNDPFAAYAATAATAEAWGATLIDAGEAGHINADSGHGPWPEGLMAFGGFLNKL